MAKRFGVTDAQIQTMADPASPLFTEWEKIALRYAEQVTQESHRVSDALFDRLRSHFSQAAILEITAVIGLFNYFNRFNNALAMDITK